MNRSVMLAALAAAFMASPAMAQDSREAMKLDRMASQPAPTMAPETVSVEIRADNRGLWSGTLTMGPQYGNASFSQSKSEFAPPCAGDRSGWDRPVNSNTSLNFNISRSNWQQEPDEFNVNFSWTRPLSSCEGQGTDNFGFNRRVDIEPGGTITIEGAGGIVARITRLGR